MKLVNSFRTSGGFILLALMVILPGQLADADPIIHESATMGAAGQISGWGIDSVWFMGSRFYIAQHVQVTAIGGHMLEWTAGNLFGAIVYLDSATDFPDGPVKLTLGIKNLNTEIHRIGYIEGSLSIQGNMRGKVKFPLILSAFSKLF